MKDALKEASSDQCLKDAAKEMGGDDDDSLRKRQKDRVLTEDQVTCRPRTWCPPTPRTYRAPSST